jgi:hypothetical protein
LSPVCSRHEHAPQSDGTGGPFAKVGECLYRHKSAGAYYALVKRDGKQFRQPERGPVHDLAPELARLQLATAFVSSGVGYSDAIQSVKRWRSGSESGRANNR